MGTFNSGDRMDSFLTAPLYSSNNDEGKKERVKGNKRRKLARCKGPYWRRMLSLNKRGKGRSLRIRANSSHAADVKKPNEIKRKVS